MGFFSKETEVVESRVGSATIDVTLKTILGTFTTTIENLLKVQSDAKTSIAANQEDIVALQQENKILQEQAAQAESVMNKLKTLIEG